MVTQGEGIRQNQNCLAEFLLKKGLEIPHDALKVLGPRDAEGFPVQIAKLAGIILGLRIDLQPDAMYYVAIQQGSVASEQLGTWQT